MAHLPPLPKLRELYLSHNGIKRLEALCGFPGLEVLDVSSNALEDVSDLAKGSGKLTDLWLNDNRIGGGGGGGGGVGGGGNGSGGGGKEASSGGGNDGDGNDGDGNDGDEGGGKSQQQRQQQQLQTVEAAVLSYLRASGSAKTLTCVYLARNPVSVDAPAGLMSQRPVLSSSSSALRRTGGGGAAASADNAASELDEEEGRRAERRAARAAFVRELAAALPALAELDGDDLPAGARL